MVKKLQQVLKSPALYISEIKIVIQQNGLLGFLVVEILLESRLRACGLYSIRSPLVNLYIVIYGLPYRIRVMGTQYLGNMTLFFLSFLGSAIMRTQDTVDMKWL